MRLRDVAAEIERRLTRLFIPDETGRRPCHAAHPQNNQSAGFENLVLFYEYFHAETGAGLGASHQTGWTALITHFIEQRAANRQTTRTTTPDPSPST
jgi:hypothetical protein